MNPAAKKEDCSFFWLWTGRGQKGKDVYNEHQSKWIHDYGTDWQLEEKNGNKLNL